MTETDADAQNVLFHIFRNQSIFPINQLLCCLRYHATGSTQLSAADFCGFSASSANRIIHRGSEAIARLSQAQIHFPTTQQEIAATKLAFYDIARFPNVIGAIDCTHVKILSPGKYLCLCSPYNIKMTVSISGGEKHSACLVNIFFEKI